MMIRNEILRKKKHDIMSMLDKSSIKQDLEQQVSRVNMSNLNPVNYSEQPPQEIIVMSNF